MEHKEILEVLRKNKGSLEASPEDALLKIAREKSLVPAQLEKMAQLYNSWHTVSHYENAADRASTPNHLVDPPALKERYLKEDGQEKSASLNYQPTTDCGRINFFNILRRTEVEKAAAQEVVEAVETPMTVDQIKEAACVLRGESFAEACKVARELVGVSDLTSACHDARYSVAESKILKAAAFVADTAKSARFAAPFVPTLADLPEKRRRSIDITCDDASKLIKLAEHLDDFELAGEAIKQAADEDKRTDEEKKQQQEFEDIVNSDVTEQQMRDAGAADDVIAAVLEARAKAEAAPTDSPPTTNGTVGGAAAQPVSVPEKEKEKKPSTPDAKHPDPENETADRIKGMIMAPIGAANAVAQSVGNSIQSGANKAVGIIGGIASADRQNKAQIAADTSVGDIQRQIRFARMINNDPILREHDKTRLATIYNSLSKANPSMAEDMESMRLTMREAASYDGVTPEALSQLAVTRKNTADAQAREKELEKQKYNTSGKELANVLNQTLA